MIIQTSEQPGSHERHLLRKVGNPLFPGAPEFNDDILLNAQRLDHDAVLAFQDSFRSLLEEVTSLTGNVESDVILQLKDRLDQSYEVACAVGGEQSQVKEAIRKLLRFIIASVRRGAGNDAHAQMELDQEEAAREAHFALLDSPLVTDLLQPESPILPDELIPVLLSSGKDDLQLALQIFDEVQLLAILEEGAKLLEKLRKQGMDVSGYEQNLAFIQGYAEFLKDM